MMNHGTSDHCRDNPPKRKPPPIFLGELSPRAGCRPRSPSQCGSYHASPVHFLRVICSLCSPQERPLFNTEARRCPIGPKPKILQCGLLLLYARTNKLIVGQLNAQLAS